MTRKSRVETLKRIIMKKVSKKIISKKSKSKKVEPALKKADLVMKTSDLALLLKKLHELNVSEVRIETFSDGEDFNAIDFDFNSSGRISFFSCLGEFGGVARMFLKEFYGEVEDLLKESRPLQIYINEYGE